MKLLAGEKVAETIDALIKKDVQCHHYETDLTAGAVFRLIGPGAVDFGGSELEAAPREEVSPRTASGEEFGWWELAEGTYVVRFNEVPELAINQIAFMQPHERLIFAGATHPSFHFRDTREAVETLLVVGPGGIRIKQNARVTKLLIIELEG